jgi:hypothetical protein
MLLFPFVGVCISLGVAVQLVSLKLGWLHPSLGGTAMIATRNIECEVACDAQAALVSKVWRDKSHKCWVNFRSERIADCLILSENQLRADTRLHLFTA